MNAIEVDHLSKQFGVLVALNDISFSVANGRDFWFLGPNGAGKTTTSRILTGISPPTGRTATVFGKDIVRETTAVRKTMGIVHETSNIYVELSAWQKLMFTAELYTIGKKNANSGEKNSLNCSGSGNGGSTKFMVSQKA
jgi:ABC-2 type transport system ATP-binding protein